MTKKANTTNHFLTAADFLAEGKKLREVEVFGSDGESLGIVHLRQVAAKDVLRYTEGSDKREMTSEMLMKCVVDADGAPLWASTLDVEEIPLPIYKALSDAVQASLGIKGAGENAGNVSGEADGSASPTA